MLNAVRAIRTPVLLLFIFAVVAAANAAQSDGDGREVVQASEILEKIERGELIKYTDKIIDGNISISDLKLPKNRIDFSIHFNIFEINIFVNGSNEFNDIKSRIILQNCLFKGNLDFSNAFIQEPVSFNKCTFLAGASFINSSFIVLNLTKYT
jgi:hypothetical protein